jgi:hypothetical protein
MISVDPVPALFELRLALSLASLLRVQNDQVRKRDRLFECPILHFRAYFIFLN